MKIRLRSFDLLRPSCSSRATGFAGYGVKFAPAFLLTGIYTMEDVIATDEDVFCQLLADLGDRCDAKAMDKSKVRKAFATAGASVNAAAAGGRLADDGPDSAFDQHTADVSSAASGLADRSDRRGSASSRENDRSRDRPRDRSCSRDGSRDRSRSRERSPGRRRDDDDRITRLVEQNERMMALLGVRVP